jgi:hypothetical protein
VQIRSFTPVGTPASGPTSRPAARSASIRFASSRAWSGTTVVNMRSVGSSRSSRSRTASTASTGDSSFAAMLLVRVVVSIWQISPLVTIASTSSRSCR